MIALLKYGTGMPFHRLERLQADLQIPLPASTQWEIVEALAAQLRPVLAELMRQAANGDVVHNDDTSMTVLSLERPGAPRGDLFMSLIHTCELAGANPFQYLTELQHHADAAALNPTAWLPWTYQDALAAVPAAPG